MKKLKTLVIGKEKIDVYFDNFEYFQPNIHKCGDCSIRCVCAAEDMNWFDVFDGLAASARKGQWAMGVRENIDDYLTSLGYEWHAITPKKGERRPTVAGFARMHPNGRYVMYVAGHVVGGKNGKYMDIWDSGNKSLYGYWIKKS